MQSIKLKSRVSSDGILQLQVPLELANKELELVIVYQPLEPVTKPKTPEELGYPPDFFEKTAGAWQGNHSHAAIRELMIRGFGIYCDLFT